MNYTEHIAGPVRNGVQKCKRCGFVLRSGMGLLAGQWATGRPVYVNGVSMLAHSPINVTINECGRSEADTTVAQSEALERMDTRVGGPKNRKRLPVSHRS